MLFSDQRLHSLALPAQDTEGKPTTLAYLINHLCQNVMNDTRSELFILEGHLYVSSSAHTTGHRREEGGNVPILLLPPCVGPQ